MEKSLRSIGPLSGSAYSPEFRVQEYFGEYIFVHLYIRLYIRLYLYNDQNIL